MRELALFNLAVDSKLRSCDLVKLRVRDVTRGDRVAARTIVMQQKTGRPVQFEITEQTRESIAAWISHARKQSEVSYFPVACERPRIFPRASTLESYAGGSARSDSIRQSMARIRCVAPKRH